MLRLLGRLAAPPEGFAALYVDRVTRRLRVALTGETLDIEHTGRRGQANGYASLDSTGKVPSSQLPASGGGLATPASPGLVAVDSGGTTYGRTLTSGGGCSVTNGDGLAGNPTVTVPSATTSAAGIVELATDGETASGVVVQGNDSRLSNSRAPSGAAGGDLGGSYPNPTVAAILQAIMALSSTGFVARTGAGTAAARSLVPGAGISITNQDGVGGNPTISVNSEIPSNAANTRIYYTQAEQTSLIWTGISGFNTGSGTISVVSGITNTYNALQVTATNANSNWPVRPGAQNVRIGHNPVFTGRFISAATTADHRIWLCFATSIGTGSTPSGQGCGVVFDPSTSANWRVYSYDGTTMSYTDTGVAYAANTMYQWSVRTTSSGVYVKIWDVTGSEPSEVSHTTNLPAAGTNMYAGLFLLFRITAGSSTIKFLSQQCSMAINNA